MKVSLNRIVSLLVIMAIGIAYSIYLGANTNDIVIVAIAFLIVPIITLCCLFMQRGLGRKITYIVLFIITIIMILVALTILFFTGTFGNAGFSIKAIGMVTLVLSPLIAAYVYLAYIQFREINSRYNGRRRNLF